MVQILAVTLHIIINNSIYQLIAHKNDDFKKNIDKLYDDLLTNTVYVNKDVEVIINNLSKCLNISKD